MIAARLFTIVALGVIAFGCRHMFRSWGNPGSVLSVAFLASLGLQQALTPRVAFGPGAAIVIVAGSVCVAVGSTLASRRPSRCVDVEVSVRKGRVAWCNAATWTFALAAVAYTRIAFTDVIVERNNYVNGVFYREAFGNGVGGSPLYRALQALMYVGAVVITLDVLARGWRRPVPWLYAACVGAQSYILSTKASTLIVLTVVATMWMAARQASARRVLRSKNLAALSVIALAAVVIVVAVTVRRAGDDANISQTIAYSYGGPPAALSEVVDKGQPSGQRAGATVAGLRDIIQGAEREFGNGLIPVELADGVYPSRINLYTWYLPLLGDFGPIGAAVALTLLGFWAGSLAGALGRRRVRVSQLVTFSLLLSLFVWAPISALTYMNFWFVLLAGAPLLNFLFRADVPPPNSRNAGNGAKSSRATTLSARATPIAT